jgi:hypothetical protein
MFRSVNGRRESMNAIRRVVVATLLAVWCFPAVSMAKPPAKDPAPLAAQATSTGRGTSTEDNGTDAEGLAAREQRARELQDFKGGGVYIYLGSGALLVVIVVILLVLLV